VSRVMERSAQRLEKERLAKAALDLVPIRRACTKCGEEKVMQQEFYWDRAEARYRADCKECVKKARRVPEHLKVHRF